MFDMYGGDSDVEDAYSPTVATQASCAMRAAHPATAGKLATAAVEAPASSGGGPSGGAGPEVPESSGTSSSSVGAGGPSSSTSGRPATSTRDEHIYVDGSESEDDLWAAAQGREAQRKRGPPKVNQATELAKVMGAVAAAAAKAALSVRINGLPNALDAPPVAKAAAPPAAPAAPLPKATAKAKASPAAKPKASASIGVAGNMEATPLPKAGCRAEAATITELDPGSAVARPDPSSGGSAAAPQAVERSGVPGPSKRAPRGTAGTFAGRRPPKDPAKLKVFFAMKEAYLAQRATAKLEAEAEGAPDTRPSVDQKIYWKHLSEHLKAGKGMGDMQESYKALGKVPKRRRQTAASKPKAKAKAKAAKAKAGSKKQDKADKKDAKAAAPKGKAAAQPEHAATPQKKRPAEGIPTPEKATKEDGKSIQANFVAKASSSSAKDGAEA